MVVPAAASGDGLKGKKVLVVMSYHQGYDGEEEIKKGIESVLTGRYIKYFWMNTKKDPQDAGAKAREAWALYSKYRPDAVITADDNAQKFFAVPYMLNRVSTPVVFCGVNDDASKYGYPAENVTGIIEKKHYRESISFARIIDPAIRRLGVVYVDSASNRSNITQLEAEKSGYSASVAEPVKVSTVKELLSALKDLNGRVDALLTMNLTGIITDDGSKLGADASVRLLAKNWAKPTISDSYWQLRQGYLCGVIKQMSEQGIVAARMVEAILKGRAVSKIPVTRNKNGLRMINITVAERLGIHIPPTAIIGTQIVTAEKAHF